MVEDVGLASPISSEPTETLSIPVNPPWYWTDIAWLVALFLLGAALLGVVYNTALEQITLAVAPAIQVSGALSQVYLLLILGIYWFAIRRAGATWEQLGVRRPRVSWMLAIPAIFAIQLLSIALINLAVIGFFTDNGFENPQLDALEQALAEPTIDAASPTTVDSAVPSIEPTEASALPADDGLNRAQNDQLERISRNVKLSIGDLAWLVLALGIIAPFSEELFFRGMIYPLQRRKQRMWVAVLLNGLLFSVAHVIPVLMPALFVIGVILAWVRERSGSIWPPFILHMLQNSSAIFAIYTVVNSGTGT